MQSSSLNDKERSLEDYDDFDITNSDEHRCCYLLKDTCKFANGNEIFDDRADFFNIKLVLFKR